MGKAQLDPPVVVAQDCFDFRVMLALAGERDRKANRRCDRVDPSCFHTQPGFDRLQLDGGRGKSLSERSPSQGD